MQELLPVTRGQLVYPSYLAGGRDPEMAAPRFLIIVNITNNPDEKKHSLPHDTQLSSYSSRSLCSWNVGAVSDSENVLIPENDYQKRRA